MTRATSKRMKEAGKLVEYAKLYSLEEAVSILKKAPPAKFNQSVEVAIKLNIDTKEKPQPVRGGVTFPHGTGKEVKVAVFCKGKAAQDAKEAGADHVGDAELIQKVSEGFLDFDKAIATPEMMRDLSRLGKILGPRGLMPSPKVGTVTDDVATAVKEAKKGKVEYKMDKAACINISTGKISFEPKKIIENINALVQSIRQNKPAQAKGQFIKSISVSTTMGPGIKIDMQ